MDGVKRGKVAVKLGNRRLNQHSLVPVRGLRDGTLGPSLWAWSLEDGAGGG